MGRPPQAVKGILNVWNGYAFLRETALTRL